MYFDSKKEEDRKRSLTYLQHLFDKEKRFEIVEKRNKRTLSQNNYLHLLLTWFAIETGNTVEYVKLEYFKKLCNADIFVTDKSDRFLGSVQVIVSTSGIDTKQMTVAIDRFRNWSSAEAGIYLPEANEEEFLRNIQVEMERQRQWL